MTRKRFIKKLMAHGISRNAANLSAFKVITERASYEDQYIYVLGEHFGITDYHLIDQLTEKIMERIPVIVDAINEIVPKMISEINRIIKGYEMSGY